MLRSSNEHSHDGLKNKIKKELRVRFYIYNNGEFIEQLTAVETDLEGTKWISKIPQNIFASGKVKISSLGTNTKIPNFEHLEH